MLEKGNRLDSNRHIEEVMAELETSDFNKTRAAGLFPHH
jgi:nucleoid-associated protein YejK